MSDTTKLERRNGSDPRDPRLDKLASYGLQTAMTIALLVGGYYARGTGEKVDALTAAQAETRTDLAVMRTEIAGLRASAQDTAELRRELAAMRLLVAALQGEVVTLRRDVDRPR